ncbi:hypothetical protein pdam_00005835 [Pocillopora damicornis]|uniref:EGF-like domain-containing protein n=1 Tax=Pocillopora damicornis TaxID=46731 RepID=A0A3M6U6M7_POCDA|nr:hypothetical protein pdam_00005835 [Pocillopora damicornis]
MELLNCNDTLNPCSSSPCLNNGTCQIGFTSKGFRCVYVHGFVGENCSGTLKFFFSNSIFFV